MRSKLEPMKKAGESLRRHRHLILNWFLAKGTISAGVVEGLNGVAKLTTRNAFGFRTAKGIKIALFHVSGHQHTSFNRMAFLPGAFRLGEIAVADRQELRIRGQLLEQEAAAVTDLDGPDPEPVARRQGLESNNR